MNLSISNSWENHLLEEFNKPYFEALEQFVDTEYLNHQCYPENEAIFNAFKYCDYHNLKVVIIGQDPYHGPQQANGLSFSVNEGLAHPPSLKNIFKELETDLKIKYPISGDLSPWAKQGALLLNATLTVRANNAGSHQKKGWETFTDAIIKTISNTSNNVVFLLWGGFAKKKAKLIDANKHLILSSGHPSPLSANRGFWFGNKHFSKTNAYLKSVGKDEINWQIN